MKIKNVSFDGEAEAEYYQSIKYYKDIDKQLSEEFYEEVEEAITDIRHFPDSGHSYLHNTKRVLLDRFPFAIIYKRKDDVIAILAIHHTKRKPSYWEKRIK